MNQTETNETAEMKKPYLYSAVFTQSGKAKQFFFVSDAVNADNNASTFLKQRLNLDRSNISDFRITQIPSSTRPLTGESFNIKLELK